MDRCVNIEDSSLIASNSFTYLASDTNEDGDIRGEIISRGGEAGYAFKSFAKVEKGDEMFTRREQIIFDGYVIQKFCYDCDLF